MAENTEIEWADHTFNPWEGCQETGSPVLPPDHVEYNRVGKKKAGRKLFGVTFTEFPE